MSSPRQPVFTTLNLIADFRNREAAIRNLAAICELVPPSIYEALLPLLGSSPDPAAVINQFERLARSAPHQVLDLLRDHPFLVHYAALIFGHSPWLGETLIHHPDIIESLQSQRSLDLSYSREDFERSFARSCSSSDQIETSARLARFKRREYVRILLRDLLGIATLAETTGEISALSDVLIEQAVSESYNHLRQRYRTGEDGEDAVGVAGTRFAVLSLGKLGGNELNYSSDIDLLFLYDSCEDGAGNGKSGREFFIRLAQQTTELLSRHTSQGAVFRIDLRLRPRGNEGELAVPLQSAIHYYSHVAQDWELQAMIKARHSAGDPGLARQFIRAIEPYVYRPELNFAAIKTALASREKIGARRRSGMIQQARERTIDVKLDRGGIRDIEFLVQCLQRLYGGHESWLRSRGTLFALQKLHDKQHFSGKDFQSLNSAYEFLRGIEHRLQLRHGRQSHRLPMHPNDLQWLARSLAREGATSLTAEQLLAEVKTCMSGVAEIYQRIVFQEQSAVRGPADFQLTEPPADTAQYQYGESAHRAHTSLKEIVEHANLSQHGRRNLERFLNSAATSSERHGAVTRSPEAVRSALTLFEHSDYLTEILVQYPADVALLTEAFRQSHACGEVDAAGLLPPIALADGLLRDPRKLDPVFAYLAQQTLDRSEALALLRQHYRRRVLLSGARDFFHARDVVESLAENTAAADAATQAALAISGAPEKFAILALGRLGACEFDVLSDADLLFVREPASDAQHAQRSAERVMETLTAYTRDGTVFPVDTRLRPHGREGELVVTPMQLLTYLREEAQPWEALTYLKLRPIAGDAELATRTVDAVRVGVATVAGGAAFSTELDAMRRRLEESEASPTFKAGQGGSYDLDYLLGTLQLRHQLWLSGNLQERVHLVHRHGLISDEERDVLIEIARLLRGVEHVVRLVTGKREKWLPFAGSAHRSVQWLLSLMLGDGNGNDIEFRLGQALRQARAIYFRHR